MAQQETQTNTQDGIERLENEVTRLTATCDDLVEQLAALRNRVRRIEADLYKDVDDTKELDE
jgi:septal ring factor EnvC (AmiA/AmiB activator)